MPSIDCTSGALGSEPQMPSTSAAVSPQSRSTAMHASAASDAWLRPELWATKPVVAAPAKATWSFIGLPAADHDAVAPMRRNTGRGVPARSIQSRSTRSPMAIASLGEPTTVLVKRRPGCSSSSTVTTGYGVE